MVFGDFNNIDGRAIVSLIMNNLDILDATIYMNPGCRLSESKIHQIVSILQVLLSNNEIIVM